MISRKLAEKLAHIARATDDFGNGSKFAEDSDVKVFAQKYNPRPKVDNYPSEGATS